MADELQIYGMCPDCKKFKKLDTRCFKMVYCEECGDNQWQRYNSAVAEAEACGYL